MKDRVQCISNKSQSQANPQANLQTNPQTNPQTNLQTNLNSKSKQDPKLSQEETLISYRVRRSNLTLKLSTCGVLIALGVVLSAFYIPVGGAKCFPAQHVINICSAVLLGPFYALANAFIISLIRNMTGLGSLLAFPGSMIGALCASLLYEKFQNHRIAVVGELFGTGLIGAILAAPLAIVLMGKEVGIFFFILPFILSSLAGSLIALVLFESTALIRIIKNRQRVNL
jgi:energy coupling factor transporter S component ThiW